jgi:hypothetical protein
MAVTEIDLERQSQDGSLVKSKLKADFLDGGDLNLTGGNNNATITGLKAGVNPNDAVNKAQLDSLVIAGGMTYKGQLDASDATGAALDGAKQGDFWYISTAGVLDGISYNVGDHLVVNADITDFDVDGSGKIDLIDNTEANDILRDGDIVDDLVTGGSDKVLSAEQGVVLKGLVDTNSSDIATNAGDIATNAGNIATNTGNIGQNASDIADLQANWLERVFGEKPATTVGSPVLAPLANIPVKAGTARVYINGLRAEVGAGNDYTINEGTGVITLSFNAKAKTKVLVDYEY